MSRNFGAWPTGNDIQDTDRLLGHRGTALGAGRGWTYAFLKTALGSVFASVSHTQAISTVTGLQTALDAKAAAVHAHAIADTTGLQAALDGKAASTHAHAIADTTGLQAALDAKAASVHTHNEATGAAAGFMSAADKGKLDGVAAGATVNASDAQLRDRSTHTGTQSADTVVDGTANKVFTAAEQTKLAGVDAGAQVNPAIATQAEAEAGVEATKMMTAQRTAQAIAAQAAGGPPSSTRETITQAAHGFSAQQAVFNNNGTWTLAKADALSTARVDGVIESVATDTFVVVTGGKMTVAGLTANTRYFLSAVTAGLLTDTAPTTATHFVVPVLRTGTGTVAYVEPTEPLSLALIPNDALATNPLDRANHTGAQAISTVTGLQTALDGKAASSHTHPISEVTGLQADLDAKWDVADVSTDGTLADNSDLVVPTEKAVKTYVDSNSGSLPAGLVALFPRAGMASLPAGFIECNGANGTTDETDVGSMAVVIKHGGTVATPTFDPPAGTYGSTQNVTINCATSGVVIKYTTDGSEPTRSSPNTYSTPVSVAADMTLKARAFRTPDNPTLTMVDSAVGSAAYTITAGGPTQILGVAFNEASGTTAAASVGPNMTLGASITREDTTSLVPPRSGYSMYINGATEEALTISNLTFGAVVTMSLWGRSSFWAVDTSGNKKYLAGTALNQVAFMTPSGLANVEAYINGTGGTALRVRANDALANSGTDYRHIVVVFDNTTTTGAIKIYINGTLAATTTQQTDKDTSGTLTADAVGSGYRHPGAIDDLRVWNGELDAAAVAALYAAGPS
jgi:hypothetical protein